MEELVNDAFGRIGENVDALMDDLIRNRDIHEGSQEFQGEDEGEERRYKSLFDDARQSLYPSCPRVLTKVSATIELYSLKAQKASITEAMVLSPLNDFSFCLLKGHLDNSVHERFAWNLVSSDSLVCCNLDIPKWMIFAWKLNLG
ncbi:hypothetical protein MRB53_032692 [Persea americana]|uniref:Uncharacterized protein n=1 Tax=Persea americana TaxID=3435 RepID=A0ACC2KSM2_PERAE|nr:hypothetical protein MRB53_032692 [Persea americana]